ncbi:hypothetical protein SDC9_97743 [bioreactor metagenome]|uniref:Uncharacterized protein n=1 Tax=bioreactor metagenome TaxID=1076179 RepID=A0A645AD98_9ZZZZ
MGIIEGVYAQVQNPVIGILVFQYHFVYRPQCVLIVKLPLLDKVVVIKVATSHKPKVGKHKNGYYRNQWCFFEFSGNKEPKGSGSRYYKEQRTESICPQKGDPVLHQGFPQKVGHLCIGLRYKRTCQRGYQCKEQRKTGSHGQGYIYSFGDFFHWYYLILFHQFLEHQNCNQRYGYLQNHKNHGDSPELAVEWYILVKEFGNNHKIGPP